MKKEISSLDLFFLVRELKQLEGGIIKKVFQKGKTIHIEIYSPGKGTKLLYYEPNIIFLTKQKRETDNQNFSQYLRKHMSGRILEIRQKDFDRILEIETGGNILVFEIFSKGNIIFCDNDYNILKVIERQNWKDREVREKIKYSYPPPVVNPFLLSKQEFREKISASEKNIAAFLASDLSLSGKYADFICEKTGLNKNCPEIKDEEIELLQDSLNELKNNFKPNIIYEGGEKINFASIDIGGEKKYFETFSEVLDIFFSIKKENSPEEKKHEKTMENYEKKLKELESRKTESRKTAEIIYNNFEVLDKIIRDINDMRQADINWSEIRTKIMKNIQVESIDEKNGFLIFSGARIDFRKSAQENANKYFETGKKAKRKLAAAEKMDMFEIKKTVKRKAGKEKRKWYEEFHWVVFNDFLVVGGRDASDNEFIFKKYIEKDDVVLHALLPGAPLVVVKSRGRKIPDDVIKEASVIAGVYSSSWKKGFGEADVYWINPEQISKSAPSGEHLPKGSFMISGKKNFIRVKMELAVGKDKKILLGSKESISKQTKKYVVLAPGSLPKNETAKKIAPILGIKKDELEKFIPSGESDIVEIIG